MELDLNKLNTSIKKKKKESDT